MFVSHGSDDLWVAAQISKELLDIDVSPFLDQTDIPLGALDFQKVIHDEISSDRELMALFRRGQRRGPGFGSAIPGGGHRQLLPEC